MTTATLARGPPISVPLQQDDDDEEDTLMDDEDGGANSPDDSRTAHALMIDEADQDGDMDSDNGGEYSGGEIVDYSGHGHSYMGRKPAGSSGSLSDGDQDGEQDNGNGSIQSYDEYHQQSDDANGTQGSYPGSGGKLSSLSLMAKSGIGGKNGKNFVCDICLKTFSNAANMRRHRVRHSGIKPFECRFCQKRFFRKDHMREHMNHKHNNTQMECYFCQQVFDKEKDLFQHVTRDHDVNPRELHCQYCSFSATTIGRYLWHMTTSHPRKNSHYIDGTGENLSMAPYALDNEYDSPQASPKLSQAPTSREAVGSSSAGHGRSGGDAAGYDFLSGSRKTSKRDAYGERRASVSPPQSASNSLLHSSEHSTKSRNLSTSNRYYGNPGEEDSGFVAPLTGGRSKSTAALDAVRYVSILPNKFLPADTSSHSVAEDLTSYALPEDLSGVFPGENGNSKSAFAMLQRKMNGNSAFVAAAFAAAAVADSTGKGGGSNRRKSKAPVRMAATPEELNNSAVNGASPAASSSVVSSSKRGRDTVLNEGARNGNEVGLNFSPILEEVMSLQHHRSGHNNFPEDLSSAPGFNGHSSTSNSRLSSALLMRQKGPQSSNTTDNAGGDILSRSAATSDQDSEQKCPHCLIIYPDNVLYMLHKMLHTKDHPYRCAQCLTQFPNRYEFYAHIVNHGATSSSVQ